MSPPATEAPPSPAPAEAPSAPSPRPLATRQHAARAHLAGERMRAAQLAPTPTTPSSTPATNPTPAPVVPPTPPSPPGGPGRTYVLLAVTGNRGHGGADDDTFRAAMNTRATDIQNTPGFRPGVDRVVTREVQDLGTLRDVMAQIRTENDAAGRDTAEVSIYSHAGRDGPVGARVASQYSLSSTPAQMTIEGWRQIDFDWDPRGARMALLGCNTGAPDASHARSFANALSAQPNLQNVRVEGQTSSSFPSQYVDRRNASTLRELTWGTPQDRLYMVGANGHDNLAVLFTDLTAHPLQVNVNGREVGREFQPGDHQPARPSIREIMMMTHPTGLVPFFLAR